MTAVRARLSMPIILAMSTTAAALGAILIAMTSGASIAHTDLVLTGVVGLALIGVVTLTYRFPIHIRQQTKIYVNSIPLALLVVLLPPPIAALAAALGQASGETMMRVRKGSPWHYIVTQSSRWALVAFVGSVVAHLSVGDAALRAVPIACGLALLWLGDMLTCPLVLWPIVHERPQRIVRAVIVDGGVAEGAQYMVALLGALLARLEPWTLILLGLPMALVYLAFKSAKELHDSTRQILESMADTVDLRDPYTGGHSRRVTELCQGILRELGMHGPDADLIIAAARVHDIGKIGIPDGVLNKPGKLTDEEWAIMATHPERGAELLARYPDFTRGVEIVRHHHEAWDGSGYPHRLQGTEIPFGARVIAVADSYDAMTSDRPYRRGMTVAKATQILRDGRGTQWDAAIVEAFLRSIADRLDGAPSHSEPRDVVRPDPQMVPVAV